MNKKVAVVLVVIVILVLVLWEINTVNYDFMLVEKRDYPTSAEPDRQVRITSPKQIKTIYTAIDKADQELQSHSIGLDPTSELTYIRFEDNGPEYIVYYSGTRNIVVEDLKNLFNRRIREKDVDAFIEILELE